MRRRRWMIAGLAVAMLLGGGLIAQAAIPDAEGIIHGCYKTSNPAKGALIVIDSAASCPGGYTALNWHEGLIQTLYVPNIRLVSHNVPTDGQVHALPVSCGSDALLSVTALAFDGDTIDDLTKLRPHALPVRLDLNGKEATVYLHATGPESATQTVVSLSCARVGPG